MNYYKDLDDRDFWLPKARIEFPNPRQAHMTSSMMSTNSISVAELNDYLITHTMNVRSGNVFYRT